MITYKLRNLFKERGGEILKSTLLLSFACASSFLVILPMLVSDEVDWKDKKQMIVFFLIASIINIISLLYVDNYDISIILKILLSIGISFCIFVPIIFLLITLTDYKDIQLDKSELRDAKLEGILRWKKK